MTGSYAGGPDNEDASLVLVPNEYAAGHWRRGYPDTDVRVVGCPKLDQLPHGRAGPSSTGPVIAVTFHWPATFCQEASNALGDFIAAIPALARQYEVIGHAHPKHDWPRRMARRYEQWRIEYVPDFDDVCRRADVLVFDNSSVGFEFAATGRPVVVMNARQYRRNVDHGLRFWDAATVGVQANASRDAGDNAEILSEAVRLALVDDPETQIARERALGIVYGYRTGAAERAARAIEEWAA